MNIQFMVTGLFEHTIVVARRCSPFFGVVPISEIIQFYGYLEFVNKILNSAQ